jgi:scyllo-inositol 2-dehydrogenase (NADP+)
LGIEYRSGMTFYLTSMSEKQITVAIVGLGRVGWSSHFQTLSKHPRFKLVAVADPLEERRKEAEKECPGCVGYPDLDTLLANCDAELIVEATPTPLHEPDAAKIFKAGRHCLLEKPMAFDYHGALRIAEMAKAAGKALFVNHQHMFMPAVHMLKSVIESGKLGKVFSIRFNWGSYKLRNDWQTLKKNGGGLLNNHGPHSCTVLTPLLDGDIIALSSFLKHVKDAGDSEDHVEFFLETDKGQVCSVVLTTCQAVPSPTYILLGEYGSLVCENGDGGKLRYYNPEGIFPLEVIEGANMTRSYKFVEEPNWIEETISAADFKPTASHHDNIADVLLDGKEQVVSVASALQVQRILHWAREGSDPAKG